MGKKSRAKAYRTQERTVDSGNTNIPEHILHGAELVLAEAKKHGNMEITLPPNSYRQLDQFELSGHRVEIGSIGRGSRRINNERVRQLFNFALSLASKDAIETHSFDPKREAFAPATIKPSEHNVDGYLVYLPAGAARYTRAENSFSWSSFTTGKPLLGSGEPSVSFVTSDTTVRPADAAMSTATEIMQNRCIISAVSFDGGKSHTELAAVKPYQESLANGVGNLAGAVALGWTYDEYQSYLEMYEKSTGLWGGTIKGVLGRSTDFIAPHIMFGQETFDQLADGQIPDALDITSRQPLRR